MYMEYFDSVLNLLIVLIPIAIATIVLIFLRKKKKIKLTGITLGPFSTEIETRDIFVDKIEILDIPIASSVGEVLTPPLRIRVCDANGHPVKKKRVRLEIFDENGLLTAKSFIGQTSKLSNRDGIISFDDITLSKTGRYSIFICVDTLEEKIENIDVFPPGLSLDFWNETVGSPQYEEKLDRALRMSGNTNK